LIEVKEPQKKPPERFTVLVFSNIMDLQQSEKPAPGADMTFFAVITESELTQNDEIHLVAQGNNRAALRNTRFWSRLPGYPKLDRYKFQIDELESISLISTETAREIPAKICQLLFRSSFQ
jgi:hypothetical protein